MLFAFVRFESVSCKTIKMIVHALINYILRSVSSFSIDFEGIRGVFCKKLKM